MQMYMLSSAQYNIILLCSELNKIKDFLVFHMIEHIYVFESVSKNTIMSNTFYSQNFCHQKL